MEPTNNKSRRLRSGYNFKTSRSRINLNANNSEKKKLKTSNGWFMLAFLCILWICIFLIAYFHHDDMSYSQALKNAFVIPSWINFGITLLWWSGRSLIFSHLTYSFYKLGEVMKLRSLKRFLKMNQEDKYFDNLDSYDEYYKYVELKKKNTKLSFYISISIFTVLAIITLIVALV